MRHFGEQRLGDREGNLKLFAQDIVYIRQDRYIELIPPFQIARQFSGLWGRGHKKDSHGIKPMAAGFKLLQLRDARLAPSAMKESEDEWALRKQLPRPYKPPFLVRQKEFGKLSSPASA